ncbi:alpha/beta hydrolase family protein [Microbulbifer hydrolyticus]|uniref:Acylaminoacyl-peptidase n=1 Tax=Microbulbifer hydrolyticus TaxID=48074 RepID=A0A6P1T841_9GAMM|nr:S9 family peptidase [Microbulbifer hydrolyticus]MBB5211574.1 acylaminoacyl-peptidase [Microbulbifer hydrolyticus]QHQ37686.1 prolyl oligopeptidase family serine peptidase [Microbulbifer hydrolyticus]
MKILRTFAAALVTGAVALASAPGALAAEKNNKVDGTFADSLGEMPVSLDELFRPVAYANIRISPDGKHIAAGKVREDGLIDGVIIDRRTMEIKSTLEMDGSVGVSGIQWANNERVLFSFSMKSATAEGTGTSSIAAMNIDGSRKEIIWRGTGDYGGNESAGLSGKIDDEHYRVVVYPSGSGLNFPLQYIYKLNIYTGKTSRIARSPIRLANPIFDKKGEISHWVGRLPDSFDDTVVATRNSEGGWDKQVFANDEGVFAPIAWTKDEDWMWYSDTVEAPTKGLYKVNVETGAKKLVYRHPKVDYDKIHFDDDGNPWGATINYDYPKVVYIDEDNHYTKTHKRLQGTFPNKVIRILNRTADGNEWVVHVSDDRHPGIYYIYNQFDGALKFLANTAEWIDPETIPATHPVRFTARDGLEINGYITLPVNKEAKDLPLIILPHGGPHGPRDYWGYNKERVLLANAGYAVMHVNFRGSGGYGRDFLYDWYGHWGMEMQDDLTDATHWAIKSGIADPDRICIYGASYGGYAAMMGITKEPDLYQCGIGYVGVYDMAIFSTHGDIRLREAGRKYLAEATGTDPEVHRQRSPARNAERIKAPVFLVQGERDTRVPIQHYYAMRDALEAEDHALETLLAPRAAHGAREQDSQLEIYCRMIDFFNRHIGDGKPTDPPADDCVPKGALGLDYKYYEGVKRG